LEAVNEDVEEVEHLFNSLRDTLRSSQRKFLKLFDSINAIRETYTRVLGLQDGAIIRDNVNLNFNLLELEEFFLENGIISIEEIKDTCISYIYIIIHTHSPLK
jgi:hypothetical protein